MLIPHGVEEAAERLAAGMHVSPGPDGATVIHLSGRDGPIHVGLRPDGGWSVWRGAGSTRAADEPSLSVSHGAD